MNKPAMSDTQDDLKEAQDELAGLIFQCARYERPSMDWKEALAEYTELCRAHFAKQDAEPSIQLELPKSWHFKCRRCGSEQNGEFQYARTPITSENCVPRINELLSDCVEVLGAFPESKGRLHDALVTSIINYLLPPAKEAPPIPADMVMVPREPTEERLKRGVRAFQSGFNGTDNLSDWLAFWQAMITDAPANKEG